MKRPFLILLFLMGFGTVGHSQSNFLVSCPAELKMNGLQDYFFFSHKCYIIYNTNASNLKIVINMYDLKDKSNAPIKGEEIAYNPNSILTDTNCLIFDGFIAENKIKPTDNIKEEYTFNITGTVKFRDITYVMQVVCSYGAKMFRNQSQSQVSLNVNLEILKMDYPMYVPAIKAMIDNLKIEIIDGTVNMVSN